MPAAATPTRPLASRRSGSRSPNCRLSTPIAVEPGKSLFYVQCGVPVCAEIAVGLEAAAEAAGWEYETASHQDTPDTVASAFDAAIAAEPDVVMTSGNPREWFAPQLATLEEMGVPVVAWSMPEAYEPGEGVSVNLLTNDDYYFYGVLMADYAAATTTTQNILFVGLPTFPVLSTVQQGFEDEIATACPDCTVEVTEVAVTDLGTNLPGTIVSALQANPDLDMIVYAFGGMLFGVPEAIESAGLGRPGRGHLAGRRAAELRLHRQRPAPGRRGRPGLRAARLASRRRRRPDPRRRRSGPRRDPRGRRHRRPSGHPRQRATAADPRSRLDRRPDRAVGRRRGLPGPVHRLGG